VDFDGTIATVDTTDAVLEAFADPCWQAVEAEWKAGRIGSRECLVRQISLLRATPQELDDLISTFRIDPHFEGFVEYCQTRDIGIRIVSDGLDRSIATVLRRAGIDVPYFANRLEYIGGGHWRLSFPNARSDCRALAGNCKCAALGRHPRALKVVIGDGRSDFCMAEEADLVIAKSALLRLCVDQGLPHHSFVTFADAAKHLDTWLAKQATGLQPADITVRND